MTSSFNNLVFQYVKQACLPLLLSFIDNSISGLEFETKYLRLRDNYHHLYDESPFIEILSAIFRDVDDFWYLYDPNNPVDRDDPWCIDEVELKKRCIIHYNQLMKLVKNYQVEKN
jgi:hypothetical protein